MMCVSFAGDPNRAANSATRGRQTGPAPLAMLRPTIGQNRRGAARLTSGHHMRCATRWPYGRRRCNHESSAWVPRQHENEAVHSALNPTERLLGGRIGGPTWRHVCHGWAAATLHAAQAKLDGQGAETSRNGPAARKPPKPPFRHGPGVHRPLLPRRPNIPARRTTMHAQSPCVACCQGLVALNIFFHVLPARSAAALATPHPSEAPLSTTRKAPHALRRGRR